MQYGDFSSIVQLGVGLHIGTALLQLFGDTALQPLIRSIERIQILVREAEEEPTEDLRERASKLSGDFDIFKINMSKEYKRYLIANGIVSVALAVVLVFIAYAARLEVQPELSVVIVALSLLPAPITLLALWIDGREPLGRMLKEATFLEAALN